LTDFQFHSVKDLEGKRFEGLALGKGGFSICIGPVENQHMESTARINLKTTSEKPHDLVISA
jgi:hypothetical protein